MTNEPKTAEKIRMRVVHDLTLGDLFASLRAGFADFLRHPQFGMFFAGFYVLVGLFFTYATFVWGQPSWMIPAIAGFPLLAPFVAVGLYEVSRRRDYGIPMQWKAIIGALKGHGDEQIMSMGVIVFVAFGFWMIIAHAIFAIFMAESGLGSESIEAFMTPVGLTMLGVGSIVGAILAFAFYSITVISLPMLVDRKVDFLTAIIASLKTMRRNMFVMLVWAAIISILLFIAMLPGFLGLFIALPVLGHATWHLYRRAVVTDEKGTVAHSA